MTIAGANEQTICKHTYPVLTVALCHQHSSGQVQQLQRRLDTANSQAAFTQVALGTPTTISTDNHGIVTRDLYRCLRDIRRRRRGSGDGGGGGGSLCCSTGKAAAVAAV